MSNDTVMIAFTVDEANRLLSVLVQTPIPYQLSAPLIQRVGGALSEHQHAQLMEQHTVNDARVEAQHEDRKLQPVPNN